MAYDFSIEYSVDFSRVTSVTLPPIIASPNGALVFTQSGFIINAIGEKWTITTGNKVAINGVADAATANVVAMYYINGFVYHMNTSRNWYRKATSKDLWAFTTCPVPNS